MRFLAAVGLGLGTVWAEPWPGQPPKIFFFFLQIFFFQETKGRGKEEINKIEEEEKMQVFVE